MTKELRQIDHRPLTKAQWMLMFMGPDWDAATIAALSFSLPKAYEIHSERIHAAWQAGDDR